MKAAAAPALLAVFAVAVLATDWLPAPKTRLAARILRHGDLPEDQEERTAPDESRPPQPDQPQPALSYHLRDVHVVTRSSDDAGAREERVLEPQERYDLEVRAGRGEDQLCLRVSLSCSVALEFRTLLRGGDDPERPAPALLRDAARVALEAQAELSRPAASMLLHSLVWEGHEHVGSLQTDDQRSGPFVTTKRMRAPRETLLALLEQGGADGIDREAVVDQTVLVSGVAGVLEPTRAHRVTAALEVPAGTGVFQTREADGTLVVIVELSCSALQEECEIGVRLVYAPG